MNYSINKYYQYTVATVQLPLAKMEILSVTFLLLFLVLIVRYLYSSRVKLLLMEGLKSYLTVVEPHLLTTISGKVGDFIHTFQELNPINEEVFITQICNGKYDRAYYQNLKSKAKKLLQALAIISPSKGNSLVKKNMMNVKKNLLSHKNS